MMKIDCNAFLGNWAFRPLRNNDVPGLLAMMDHFGLDRACVASADAIMYRDSHAGNKAIYEATREAPERFWLYATLNPAYAGWQRDLATCVEWGFKAVRIYPYYHQYAMDGPEAAALIAAAAEAGLPIAAPFRVVDLRQRHWMDVEENLNMEAFLSAAAAHPEATFILTEFLTGAPRGDDLWKRLRDANVYVEMSRTTSVLQNNLGIMLSELGPERILFGTGYPFKTPSPAFLKIDALDAGEEAKASILGGNAATLFAE